MTTQQRSDFFGVYNNTNPGTMNEVPFRAAICRNKGRDNEQWLNLGYTKTEAVAARIYNMYAVAFFGKGAIINDVTLTPEELGEFEAFIEKKEKRKETLANARARAHKVLADGHKFRKHTEVAPRPQQSLPV
jgi:hypothetical protein